MVNPLSRLLLLRKKKKKSFPRQEAYRYKKIKDSWRSPKGRHSKLRKGERSRGKKPSMGYGSPKAIKGMTSIGRKPVLVSNKADLSAVDAKKDTVVVSSGVGRKKRLEIMAEAEKLGIHMTNAYRARMPGSK